MYLMEKNNKIIMPEEDVERNMYYAGRSIMEQNGIMQYEISNFAKDGYECKHNLKYWNQEEYLGFGPSAHSFLDNIRFSNPSDISLYCDNAEQNLFNRTTQEILDEDALIFEYIMLKLRLTDGLDTNKFKEKFNVDFYNKYEKQIRYLLSNNLIECFENNIKLTNRGMDISNYVFEEFMI